MSNQLEKIKELIDRRTAAHVLVVVKKRLQSNMRREIYSSRAYSNVTRRRQFRRNGHVC